MSYFRYIDNGEGPTKLFVGGLHGNEGKTSIKFLKGLKKEDFAPGQIYLYNFDKSKYISTLKSDYFKSGTGLKLLNIIDTLKPDFYTELHCYNITHFNLLTSVERFNSTGVPPLIDCGNHVLISSVSPLIRLDHFSRDTVCKTLEFPCLEKLNDDIIEKTNFDYDASLYTYWDLLKLITLSSSRREFESNILDKYPHQVELAIKYVSLIFGKDFPPY